MSSGRLRFRILGPLAVYADEEALQVGGPKQRALLALLLLSANRVVSRERLLAELFVELSPDSADHALRNQVSRLRKVLSAAGAEPARLVARPPGYLLRVEPGELDLEEFERLLADGREALAAGDPSSAARSLRAADALWSGHSLADLDLEGTVRIETERLEEMRLAAVEERIDAELALGRQRELVGELEALSGEHPYRERFRAQLMLALYRSGRQAEGLEVYRRTRTLFDDELGLVPGVELQELERAILVQDPALRRPEIDGIRPDRPPSEKLGCPFKGLAPFEPDDAELFFGRERLVDELLARLDGSSLLLMTGPSGSGKSSLLRAGLLPRLQGRRIVLRPGVRPTAELDRAVDGDLTAALDRLRPGERVVIAVDQLEEAFAAGVDEGERTAFFTTLVEAAWDPERRALVLLAMRGDFVDRLVSYPELSDLVASDQALVGTMSASELRRAIEGPAERAGLVAEQPLVDALVHEVVGEPGGLPLLSAALVDLWRDRSGSSLTLSAYERVGGIHGAVARHAEAALRSLAESEQPIARRIVLGLVSGGDGEPLTRRRISRDELGGDDAEVEHVLAALVERRLLVSDADSVELVHDALLQRWPRLADWLDEEADRRRLHRHLAQAAAAWAAADRDRSDLYRGSRLAGALEWVGMEPSGAGLSPLEDEFLRESQDALAGENERQRRMSRRRRGLLATALALLVAAAAAGVIAFVEDANAQQRSAAADAQRLGAQALVDPSFDTSLLLAREGVNLDDSTTTRANLLDVLLRFPTAIGVASNPGARIIDEAISPGGHVIAYRTDDGTVTFLHAGNLRRAGSPFATGNQLAFFGQIDRFDQALAFSPDGRTLAAGSSTGHRANVYLVDTRTHLQTAYAKSGPTRWATPDVLFSPDGRTLVTGEIKVGQFPVPPPEVIVNRNPVTAKERVQSVPLPQGHLIGFVDKGRELLVTIGETKSVLLNARTLRRVRSLPRGGIAAVSRDGELAAFRGSKGSVVLFDLRTDQATPLRGRLGTPITSLAFSRDGNTIASTTGNRSVAVWDVATMRLQRTFAGHTASPEGPMFSHDSGTLYAGGADGNLIAWDVQGHGGLGTPFSFDGTAASEDSAARATAVSADSSLFATSPAPGRITLWRAGNDTVDGRLSGPTGGIETMAFSHQGRLLAAAGSGPKVVVWNVSTGTARLLRRPDYVPGADFPLATVAVAFSPDDRRLATVGDDGVIRIYDLRNGSDIVVGRNLGGLSDVDFSSDGRLLAAAGLAGQISVWNLEQHKLAYKTPTGAWIPTLRFSPDGKTIATGNSSGDVDFWDADTGRRLPQQFASVGGTVDSLSFDPSGKRLMTTNGDGSIRLWDIATGEPIGVPLPGADTSGWGTFFPNGKQIVAVFGSGTGVLWNVDPTRWSALACRIANRNLTRAEWRAYLPNRSYGKTCP